MKQWIVKCGKYNPLVADIQPLLKFKSKTMPTFQNRMVKSTNGLGIFTISDFNPAQ